MLITKHKGKYLIFNNLKFNMTVSIVSSIKATPVILYMNYRKLRPQSKEIQC